MLEGIVSTLKRTADSNAFCTKIEAPYQGLSITVDPVGSLEFPISTRTAKKLIVEAEPAKFGKRDKTILDRKVRDVWEIPQSRITTNDAWNEQLEQILKQIQKNLDLHQDGNLKAELHNMLVYMPGQFFKGHQDSEKTDGMIATLVVLLQSEFTGGALVIDQHGDKKTFQASSSIREKITFIAFYSDCHHEVKEVIEGYRVALTYNLIFKASSKTLPSRANEKLQMKLAEYFSASGIKEVRSYESRHPRWFVYLLDHQYSQKSLGWQMLRGADRERIAELLNCADNLGLVAHLVLADIHETWITEGDDWGYDRYRRGRYGGYYDDEDNMDDESIDVNDLQLTELLDDDIELCHWVDRSGRSLNRKGHSVPQSMVCWTKAVDDFNPMRTEYEGYMGNYGNTLDRWYHRAAIVLWKKEIEFANLFVSDSSEALEKIAELLKEDLHKGQAAIRQILPLGPNYESNSLDASKVFEVASLSQNPKIASQLVKPLRIASLFKANSAHFLKMIDAYGEDWCIDCLQSWGKSREWDDLKSITENLVPLAKEVSRHYRKVSLWILEHYVSETVKEDISSEKESSVSELKETRKERMKMLSSLFMASRVANESGTYRKLIEHILKHPRSYPAIELAGFLDKLVFSENHDDSEKWGNGNFLNQLKIHLEKELSFKREQGDWSIRLEIPHSCEDCKRLWKFLSSPTDHKLIWPLAKDRRQHIHQIIDGMDIPVTHVTERVGSPHKLVLTKTSEIFERDKARLKAAEEGLVKLAKFNAK